MSSSQPSSLEEHARRLRRREILETLRHDVLPRVVLAVVVVALVLLETGQATIPI